MFRSCQAVLVLIALLLTSLRAEEPRASVPVLKVGDSAQTSFLAEGFVYSEDKRGIMFRIATDGKEHLFTLADAADGVPFFISNGNESLLYDLAKDQITLVPKSCFGFHFDFRHKEEVFGYKLTGIADNSVEKRRECLPTLDFQHLPESKTTPAKTVAKSGTITYEVTRSNKKRHRLEYHPEQPDWFRYTMYDPGCDDPAVEVRVTQLGKKIPAELLRFPDPQKFSDKCVWHEERVTEAGDVSSLISKRFWMTKYIVAIAGEKEEQLKFLVPDVSSDELLARDKKLGASYLQELKAQEFEPVKKLADLPWTPR